MMMVKCNSVESIALCPQQSSTSSQVSLGQRSVWGLGEQPEQSRPRKKTETQARMKAGDRESYEDSRCVFQL